MKGERVMKVKVANDVYTPEDYPIMVILDDKDKENIAGMEKGVTKYACFSDKEKMNDEEKKEWAYKIDNRREVNTNWNGQELLSKRSALVELTKEGQCGLHLPEGCKLDPDDSLEAHTVIAAGIMRLIGTSNLSAIAVSVIKNMDNKDFVLPELKLENKAKDEKGT